MCDAGVFEGRNIILVDGELLEMPAPNPPHNTAVTLADYLFKTIFQTGFVVRVLMGLELGQSTDPVPDLAVVVGNPRTFATIQPTTAELVSDASWPTPHGRYSVGTDRNTLPTPHRGRKPPEPFVTRPRSGMLTWT